MSSLGHSSEEPPAVNTPVLSDTRRDAVEAVTWPVRVAAAWTWRLLVIGAGLYVLVRAVAMVSLIAFGLVIAVLLTAVLHPLELRLRAVLPGPRSLASAITLIIGLAVLGAIGYFVSWQITEHSTQLADQITEFVNKTRDWLRDGPLHLQDNDFNNLIGNITVTIKQHQSDLLTGAVETIQTLAEILATLLLVALATFFFLRDGEVIWRWVLGMLPGAARPRMDVAAHRGWHTLGGYMRGVLLIALFHSISVLLVLLVLKVPLAAALAVLIFLGSFVPLIGLTVTGAFCCAVALLEHGVGAAVVVAIAITVLVQIEGHFLQPVIMSRAVEVHPLAVAVVVLSGTALAGIAGALIAVPAVAFLNTAVRSLRAEVPADSSPGGFPVHAGDEDQAADVGTDTT